MAAPPDETSPSPRLIEVFSIGCGARAQGYGPLARQLTDLLAHGLSGFDGLVARPHHLLGSPLDEATLDPNLEEGYDPSLDPNGELPDRIAFILFSSLPSDALVRRLARERGVRLALSGRMVLEGRQVDLSMNLWDVEPPNLLWCRALFGDLEELPAMVSHAIALLAYSLQASGAETRELAAARAAERVGTRSYSALRHFAAATELLRRARLTPNRPLNHGALPLSLCAAIAADPDYEAPRIMLLEHSVARFKVGDQSYAQALLDRLSKLREPRLLFDLLRVEAHLCLGQTESATRQLDRAETAWGEDPHLRAARDRLSRLVG
ncbi:MAG: hypothetical protein CMH57_07480 [Myxococcales bacterium]|nr:hypothetical protein [Myxococcales bacterium]